MADKIQTYTKEFIHNKPKTRIEKVLDYVFSDKISVVAIVPFVFILIAPAFTIPFAILAFFVLKILVNRKGKMPFSFPEYTKVKVDTFNKKPQKGENGEIYYGGANGIAYFGNISEDNTQAWFSNSKLRQHVAFLAATGSGKTFTIASIACINALLWGAGYLYADAKADLALVQMHQSPGWRMNRVDDYFLLNFIQGSRSVWDPFRGDKTTNTYNILESGTAAQNTETMKSLMQGDNDIWAKRADALLASLISPTTFMRDQGMITLSVITFLDYLTIENAGAICGNELVPEQVKKPLMGFIKTLPGMSAKFYEEIIKGNSVQSTQVYDQWGFAAMQCVLVLNMLSGDYGRIFGVTVGEIDLEAIVLQDRILIALLPALEASAQSVASMGRILMAARKGVMGRTLGEAIEGDVKVNLEQRPANAPYPYIQVIDEAGMIFAEGEGSAAAQARGLGYSLWYSSQDLPAMKKLSDTVAKEVMTVMGNTIIKIAGRIIDDETFEEYSKLFDEEYVWQRDGTEFSITTNGSQVTHDSRGSYTKRKRLDKREVQKLGEGEMYISAEDRLFQVNGPNLHPEPLKHLMLNDFVPFIPYSMEDIDSYTREFKYLNAEYNLIIEGKSELNEVPPPTFTQLPVFASVLDKVTNFVENLSEANQVSFATFTRLSFESLSDQINQKADFYKNLETASRDSLGLDISNELPGGDEIEVVESKFKDEVLSDDVSDIDSSLDLEFSSTSTENQISENQTNGLEEPSNLSVLDSYFASQGLSKDHLLNDFAQINALAGRSDLINHDLDTGAISLESANSLMNQPISKSEENEGAVSASKIVQEMYARTTHPGKIKPQKDKQLAMNLLRSVYLELIRTKQSAENKEAEDVT